MPVRDRLAELQQKSKYCKEGENLEETEMKPLKGAQEDSDFDSFLEVAQDLATGIAKVQQNVANIKLYQKKVLNEPSKVERDKHQAALNDLVEENKISGRRLQKVIKEEQAKNEKLEKRSKMTSKEMSELNIRKTQIQTQSKRFLEIWTEYNNLQVDFRDRTKKALVKNIKITNNQLTDEQIEEKIENNDISAFSSSIIQETAMAKDQLVAIENRHAEILKLERGIVEIHDMFIDLSNLVSMQGEMIDRIQDNVEKAGLDVERGRDNLKSAEKSKIRGNKMKFCLGGVGLVVILIIILVLLSEFGAFSGGSEKTIVQHHYHMSNGTTIVSDNKLPQLVAPPPPPTTSTTAPTTSTESITTMLTNSSQVSATEDSTSPPSSNSSSDSSTAV